MIDIDENQAKKILDFLVRRVAKNNSLCKDYARCYMSFIESFLFVEIPCEPCYYTLYCMSSSDSISIINSVNSSYKDVLEVMLEAVSNGCTIMLSNNKLSNNKHVFMHPFECLEQLLVEKDLEV